MKKDFRLKTLASEAANLARDAVNAAREAVNLARVISIPARDAVDLAKEAANTATDFPESSLSLPRAAGKKWKNILHKNILQKGRSDTKNICNR
jgi:hypothetical protein